MTLISQGKRPNRSQLNVVINLLESRLEALTAENDALETALSTKMFFGAMQSQMIGVEHAASGAKLAIDALKVGLERAKKDRRGSIAQGLFDVAVLAATLVVPELLILQGMRMAVTQGTIDIVMGGSKGSNAVDNVSSGVTYAGIARSGMLAHRKTGRWFSWFQGAPRGFLAGVGKDKALAAVTVTLDGFEIYEAFKAVDYLESRLKVARTQWKALAVSLERMRGPMASLWGQIVNAKKVADEFRKLAPDSRRAYDAQSKRERFSAMGQFSWRYE